MPRAVSWNENKSHGFDARMASYRAAFGYQYGDMSGDGLSYATFKRPAANWVESATGLCPA